MLIYTQKIRGFIFEMIYPSLGSSDYCFKQCVIFPLSFFKIGVKSMIYISDSFRPEMVPSDNSMLISERELQEVIEFIHKPENIKRIQMFCRSNKSFNIFKALLDLKDISYIKSNTHPSRMLLASYDILIYISHNYKPNTVRQYSQMEVISASSYRIHLISIMK